MKKQAQLGQWKTPPNQVYAVTAASSAAESHAVAAASLGTKMQLMGLGPQQKRPSITTNAPQQYPLPISVATSHSSSPQPIPFPPQSATGFALVDPRTSTSTNGGGGSSSTLFAFGLPSSTSVIGENVSPGPGAKTSTKSMLLAPNASPIASSPFEMVVDEPSKSPSTSVTRGKPGRKPSVKKNGGSSSMAAEQPDEVTSPTLKPASSSSGGASATPEDKERMLAHSRTMARLRRQQQRVLTDSLEAEFFELCVSAAYLKAALNAQRCSAPLQKTEVDRICQEATERSLEAIDKSIPTARSQELKTQVSSGKPNMPQAHVLPALQVDDANAMHLAVTVGSRRESFSSSTDRRKGALAWAASGVKHLYNDLNKDALPFVAVANCATGSPEANADLANRLRLTPEQRERISRMVPDARSDMARLVSAQRAADQLLTDHWLSLPKTDALMEHVRDTTTTEQMNKLISWSITNEAQIATLKLGTVRDIAAQSSSSS